MKSIRSICVYCGSSSGTDPTFLSAARHFGEILAASDIRLVYGGGGGGLMGEIARNVLAHGGQVTGIIPDFLRQREAMLRDVKDLIVVPDMHTRKQRMFDEADAFVALPGGVGTLEELVEQLTWVQLQRHAKPVLIADIGGFWRPLLSLFAHIRSTGFVADNFEIHYLVAEKIDDIVEMLEVAARHRRHRESAEKLDGRL